MSESESVHQDEQEDTESVDLTELEQDSPSDDDELEIDDSGQEPNIDIPELGIDNPEAQNLWDQRWKGVLKREKRVRANEAKVKNILDNEGTLNNLLAIQEQFDNSGKALGTLGQVVSLLKQRHGYSDEQIGQALGFTSTQEDPEFEDEADLHRKTISETERRIEEKYENRIKELERSIAEGKGQSDFSDYVDRNFNSIKKQVSELAGLKVNLSRSQVATALRARPELAKEDPAEAVYYHFRSLIKKTRTKKERRTEPKGPNMVKTSPRSGSGKKPEHEKTWSEAAREMGMDPRQAVKDLFDG